MAKSEEEIRSEVQKFISRHKGRYSSWYVGISEDPRRRLFDEHKVRREVGPWIYKWASSSNVARRIEDYFVNTLGTDGAPGGGGVDARAVYAYKKKPYTNP